MWSCSIYSCVRILLLRIMLWSFICVVCVSNSFLILNLSEKYLAEYKTMCISIHRLKKILLGEMFMSPKPWKPHFYLESIFLRMLENSIYAMIFFLGKSRSHVKRLGNGVTESFCDLIKYTEWQVSPHRGSQLSSPPGIHALV